MAEETSELKSKELPVFYSFSMIHSNDGMLKFSLLDRGSGLFIYAGFFHSVLLL